MKNFVAALLLCLFMKPAFGQELQFGWPMACTPGRDCWALSYFDHDPSPGASDFKCGHLAADGNDGTAIMLKDRKSMEKGVAVVAATDGKVLNTRDGMDDNDGDSRELGSIRASGRGCGNSVFIGHENGWAMGYCHLKKGSISVKPGQVVQKGQSLGLVGESGLAEIPFLHFSVAHNGVAVDPFTGAAPAACNVWGGQQSWDSTVVYDPVEIYASGFSDHKPDLGSLSRDTASLQTIPTNAPALIFWFLMYGSQAGDHVDTTILDSAGQVVVQTSTVEEKAFMRKLGFSGTFVRTSPLVPGRYSAKVVLTRTVPGTQPLVRVSQQTIVVQGAAGPAPAIPRAYEGSYVAEGVESGDPEALYKRGEAYWAGRGVKADWVEAAKWYLKAVEQKSTKAPYWLGRIYAQGGNGLMRNYEEAYFWYSVAERGTDKGYILPAGNQREMLEQVLTPAQIAAAQQRLAAWEKKSQDECYAPRYFYTQSGGRLCLTVDEARRLLMKEITENHVNNVKELIAQRVDVRESLLGLHNEAGKLDPEMFNILVSGGADVLAKTNSGETALRLMLFNYPGDRQNFDVVLHKLEAQQGRRFFFDPPSSLNLGKIQGADAQCPAGKQVVVKLGEADIQVPPGCPHILVKAWGAGGGQSSQDSHALGGTGGFSAGIVDVAPGSSLKVVVGGAGQPPKRTFPGAGGYNGGGNGGEGFGANTIGGSGGGGRTEVILNGFPVAIAGGGGGEGSFAAHVAFPGGGIHASAFWDDYFKWLDPRTNFSNVHDGRSGERGIGGKAAASYDPVHLPPGSDGGSKDGGWGMAAKPLDRPPGSNGGEQNGGSGGGGGYGGGGGGAASGSSGGGGGGLSPSMGTTLWGGLKLPADTEDADYVSPRGQAGQDGMVVISWPAPSARDFQSAVQAALAPAVSQ